MNQNSGFNLLELMITLSIMAILAAMAIPNYQLYIRKAKFHQLMTSITPYRTAVEICYQLNGNLGDAEINCGTPNKNDIPPDFNAQSSKTGYVKSIRTSFSGSTVTIIAESQGLGEPYHYILHANADNNTPLNWLLDPASTCLKAQICKE